MKPNTCVNKQWESAGVCTLPERGGDYKEGGRRTEREREREKTGNHTPYLSFVPLPLVTPPERLLNQDSNSIITGKQKTGGGKEVHTHTSFSCCSITNYQVRCVHTGLVTNTCTVHSSLLYHFPKLKAR